MVNFATAFALILIFSATFYFILNFLDNIKKRKLNLRYNPNEDKSKQGEERRIVGGRESISKILHKPPRPSSDERTVTPEARKDSSSFGNFFNRLQKK